MADPFTPAEQAAIAQRRARTAALPPSDLQAAAASTVDALVHLDRAMAATVLRDGQRRHARMARHALALAVAALDFALDAASDPPSRRRARG